VRQKRLERTRAETKQIAFYECPHCGTTNEIEIFETYGFRLWDGGAFEMLCMKCTKPVEVEEP
jgi:hypothetical protein